MSRSSSSGVWQRYRQRDAQAFVSELADSGSEADGRDRDGPLRQAEPVGCGRGDASYRCHHALVVRQRLAHTHEHDVREASGAAGDFAVAHGGRCLANLIDDLGGREVAVEAALTRRTERAGHSAARLTRDTECRPIGITHQDAFEQRSVMCLPQGLASVARIAREVLDRGQQGREQRLPHLLAHRCGKIGHLLRIGFEPRVVLTRQLISPESRKAELFHRFFALGGIEIGEVPWRHSALGCSENEGKRGSHSYTIVPLFWGATPLPPDCGRITRATLRRLRDDHVMSTTPEDPSNSPVYGPADGFGPDPELPKVGEDKAVEKHDPEPTPTPEPVPTGTSVTDRTGLRRPGLAWS